MKKENSDVTVPSSLDHPPHRGMRTWADPALVLVILLSVTFFFALTDGHPLFWDEYYHLLAARSWAENGTLAIGEGLYTRAAWLSVTVGWMFRTFGESIFIARLPGAVALSVWAVAVFLWVRVVAGRTAAWFASLAFSLGPIVFVNSVMVRFYGFAGLLFWLGCICAYSAVAGHRSHVRRISLGLVSLTLLQLCFEVTPLARLWIACLAIWPIGLGFVKAWESRHRWMIFGFTTLVVSLAGVWAFQSDWVLDLWRFYRNVPMWSVEDGSNVRYYEWIFRRDYPTLWTFLPLAGILSIARRPPAATMSAVIFGAGILFLSFGGAKATRYLVPIMPFLFVLWGIAISELMPGLRNRTSSLLETFESTKALPSWARRLLGRSLMAVVIAFVLLTNPGFSGVRHVLPNQTSSLQRGRTEGGVSVEGWEEVAKTLATIMEEVDVVITSNPVQTLYHVGDYDYAMSPSEVQQAHPPSEFGMDRRTGRAAISTFDSLARLVAEHNHGLVFGELRRWRHPSTGFTEEVTNFIQGSMERVQLDDEWGVIAYRW